MPLSRRESRARATRFVKQWAFAPIILPALGETKWVKQAVDQVKEEVEKVEK